MISTRLSRASALVLLVGGASLLFASDALLPRLVPGYPPAGLWLGQLLGAAWLGLASLNWLSRASILGGIYGRPVVSANLGAFFIGGTSLLGAAARDGAPVALRALAATLLLLAGIYGWLLFRGPLERDVRAQRVTATGGDGPGRPRA